MKVASIKRRPIFVFDKRNLPPVQDGVIQLADETEYIILAEIDLQGDRIVLGVDTAIVGFTPEIARIKSTGLPASTALITGQYTTAFNHVSFEHTTILDLDASLNADQTLDWTGVNFVNATTAVGTIKSYGNVITSLLGFLNSGGLTFDGDFRTIAFTDTLFDNASGLTSIIITDATTISRRFRVNNCAFISLSGESALNVSASASISPEGYILKDCNFSGGGTYLTGVQPSDNKSRFEGCRGIQNSANVAEYYMTSNAVVTTISSAGDYVKAAGATSSGAFVEKFDVSTVDNRAEYQGALEGFYKVSVVASIVSGNNKVCAIRIAKNGTTSVSSTSKTTTNASGRSEGIVCQDVIILEQGDYVEAFVANETDTDDITVEELNVIIERLN